MPNCLIPTCCPPSPPHSQGRGAPEIDVIEVGVWPTGPGGTPEAVVVNTLQMAPLAPRGTFWLDPPTAEGFHFPSSTDPVLRTKPSNAAGPLTVDSLKPRPGVLGQALTQLVAGFTLALHVLPQIIGGCFV